MPILMMRSKSAASTGLGASIARGSRAPRSPIASHPPGLRPPASVRQQLLATLEMHQHKACVDQVVRPTGRHAFVDVVSQHRDARPGGQVSGFQIGGDHRPVGRYSLGEHRGYRPAARTDIQAGLPAPNADAVEDGSRHVVVQRAEAPNLLVAEIRRRVEHVFRWHRTPPGSQHRSPERPADRCLSPVYSLSSPH